MNDNIRMVWLTVATKTWLIGTEYLCHKLPRICSFYRNYNSVLSSLMTYHRLSNKIYFHGQDTVFSGLRFDRSLVICVVFCRLLFAKLKDRATSIFFSFFTRHPCTKSASYKLRNKSAKRGVQLVSLGISTVCQIEHFDISFR